MWKLFDRYMNSSLLKCVSEGLNSVETQVDPRCSLPPPSVSEGLNSVETLSPSIPQVSLRAGFRRT